MGDVQEYFITKNVRNFYSVSISGYHIAEAGKSIHAIGIYTFKWFHL
jgi:methylmalonyl-CoA mutase N-terminal domain/subunit